MMELARAIIRISVDRGNLRAEVAAAKRDAEKQFGTIVIRPKIDAHALIREANQAGAAAGRAAGASFAMAFKQQLRVGQTIFAGGPVGPSMGRIGTSAPGAVWAGGTAQRRIGTTYGPMNAPYRLPQNPFIRGQTLLLGGPGPRPQYGPFFQQGWGGGGSGFAWPPMGGGGGGGGRRGGGGGPRGPFVPRPPRQRADFFTRSAQIATGILGYQAAIRVIESPIKAIANAARFEQEMTRVAAATQASKEEMEDLNKAAIQLGQRNRFGPTQTAHMFRILGEKGMTGAEILKIAPTALNFAAASGGKVDPEGAADVLMQVINSMKLPMEDASRIADMLGTAALKSSTDVHELGEAFKYVGPLADLAGAKLEEVLAIIMTLSQAGIRGSMAGTGTKKILTEMLQGGGLEDINEVLGRRIQLRKPGGGPRPILDVVQEIARAFKSKGFDNQGISSVMEEFNMRGGPAFGALLQNDAETLAKSLGILENSLISMRTEAERAADTIQGRWEEFGAAMESLDIRLLGPLKDNIAGLLTVLAKGANEIGMTRGDRDLAGRQGDGLMRAGQINQRFVLPPTIPFKEKVAPDDPRVAPGHPNQRRMSEGSGLFWNGAIGGPSPDPLVRGMKNLEKAVGELAGGIKDAVKEDKQRRSRVAGAALLGEQVDRGMFGRSLGKGVMDAGKFLGGKADREPLNFTTIPGLWNYVQSQLGGGGGLGAGMGAPAARGMGAGIGGAGVGVKPKGPKKSLWGSMQAFTGLHQRIRGALFNPGPNDPTLGPGDSGKIQKALWDILDERTKLMGDKNMDPITKRKKMDDLNEKMRNLMNQFGIPMTGPGMPNDPNGINGAKGMKGGVAGMGGAAGDLAAKQEKLARDTLAANERTATATEKLVSLLENGVPGSFS